MADCKAGKTMRRLSKIFILQDFHSKISFIDLPEEREKNTICVYKCFVGMWKMMGFNTQRTLQMKKNFIFVSDGTCYQ